MNRKKAASYPGREIIAKLATVLEVEPADLLRGGPSTKKWNCSEQSRVAASLQRPEIRAMHR